MPDSMTTHLPAQRSPLDKSRMIELLEQQIQRNSGIRIY